MGRAILQGLTTDSRYLAVHSLGRRQLDIKHRRLTQHVVDFGHLTQVPRVDDVFIALGTTIKIAGSQKAFRAIDLDAVLAVASAALARGATRLGVVSAMGADSHSRVFYNRVKGEMEAAVSALGYQRVVLARPSLLLGDRNSLGQRARPAERVSAAAMAWFRPLIPVNYRAIAAQDVAQALIAALTSDGPARATLLSGQMQSAGR